MTILLCCIIVESDWNRNQSAAASRVASYELRDCSRYPACTTRLLVMHPFNINLLFNNYYLLVYSNPANRYATDSQIARHRTSEAAIVSNGAVQVSVASLLAADHHLDICLLATRPAKSILSQTFISI